MKDYEDREDEVLLDFGSPAGDMILAPREAVAKVNRNKMCTRIKPVYDFFTKDWKNEKKKKSLLEEIVKGLLVLDGRYKEVKRVLGNHKARYCGVIQVKKRYANIPGVVEHELVHLLGRKYIWQGIMPKRIIKQHAIIACAVAAFLDKKNLLGLHKYGTATKKDFAEIRGYKLIPVGWHEGFEDLRFASYRIGNYARELSNGNLEKGLNLIYEVTK